LEELLAFRLNHDSFKVYEALSPHYSHTIFYIILSLAVWRTKAAESRHLKCWGMVADNLHKAGWSLGWVSAVDREGRTIWIVDAHGYGKRFIVHADEKLTAFSRTGSGDSLRIV
jgi:hypothetical protein